MFTIFARKRLYFLSCSGGRRYSRDLPQGGLEIPCVLTFTGSSPLVDKTEKLLKEVITLAGKTDKENKQPSSADTNPPNKKAKVDDEWIRVGRVCLKMSERCVVSENAELNDLVINSSQTIMQRQFPHLADGFQSTLLLPTLLPFDSWMPKLFKFKAEDIGSQ